MRYREDSSEDLARARAAVAAWRQENQAGTAEALVAAIGHQFHRDWAPVLRAVLYVIDKHAALETCGLLSGPAGASR
jgi:hypothetical protein